VGADVSTLAGASDPVEIDAHGLDLLGNLGPARRRRVLVVIFEPRTELRMTAWERWNEGAVFAGDWRHVPVVSEDDPLVFGDFGIFRTPPLSPNLVAKCPVVVEEGLVCFLLQAGFLRPRAQELRGLILHTVHLLDPVRVKNGTPLGVEITEGFTTY